MAHSACVSRLKAAEGGTAPVPPSGLLLRAGRGQMCRVLLQGPHPHVAVGERVDALDGGGECLDGGQAGHSAGDGGGADVVAVEPSAGAVRGVDDQVDTAVVDELDDGRLAVGADTVALLAYHGGLDA